MIVRETRFEDEEGNRLTARIEELPGPKWRTSLHYKVRGHQSERGETNTWTRRNLADVAFDSATRRAKRLGWRLALGSAAEVYAPARMERDADGERVFFDRDGRPFRDESSSRPPAVTVRRWVSPSLPPLRPQPVPAPKAQPVAEPRVDAFGMDSLPVAHPAEK